MFTGFVVSERVTLWRLPGQDGVMTAQRCQVLTLTHHLLPDFDRAQEPEPPDANGGCPDLSIHRSSTRRHRAQIRNGFPSSFFSTWYL